MEYKCYCEVCGKAWLSETARHKDEPVHFGWINRLCRECQMVDPRDRMYLATAQAKQIAGKELRERDTRILHKYGRML